MKNDDIKRVLDLLEKLRADTKKVEDALNEEFRISGERRESLHDALDKIKKLEAENERLERLLRIERTRHPHKP